MPEQENYGCVVVASDSEGGGSTNSSCLRNVKLPDKSIQSTPEAFSGINSRWRHSEF